MLIAGAGSCPAWQDLLPQFPLIDSVQREDFPDYGASFAYVAHFYRTGTSDAECARVRQEFRKFFRTIGYTYTSSGDYEGRWFEGVGLRIDGQDQ